ncbi:DUF6415 family natural product biosynthesis protein [Streptomyces sp. N2A]|uniref:DUF6415 family natural product biosynthesis protein n=1 Tax=Streptomyces sp. N2A TaxID=3073936 RepID=UPI0037D9AF21
MNARNESVAILAEHLRRNGLDVAWTEADAVSAAHSPNPAVCGGVSGDNGRYLTAYGYEVGQYGGERESAHRVAFLVGTGSRVESLPVDVKAISETAHHALRLGFDRPAPAVLADAEEELRGHVALLLSEARKAARHLELGSIEAQRLKDRLEAVERNAQQGLGDGRLSAHVQVRQLARDCQYLLLFLHTEEGRR